jgi:signal peptidase I
MKMNKISILTMSVVALVLSGCQSSESAHHFENKVFIEADSYAHRLMVQTDDGVTELDYDLTVGMALPKEEDVTVQLARQPELLDNYRNAYYDYTAEILPAENYDLGDLKAVIPAGSVQSEAITLNFTNLDKLDYSRNYVVPVSISDAGGEGILESGKTIYLVVREASLINAVADIDDNRAWVEWKNKTPLQNMEEFTLEALVNANSFTNEEISTIMGIEDNFLIRTGDNLHAKNQLNIAYGKDIGEDENARGSLFVEKPLLETGQWYHIAVTFDRGYIKVYVDGKLVAEKEASVEGGEVLESVDFTTGESINASGRPDEDEGRPRAFWFGFSYSTKEPTARDFDGMIAEARIWNKALTESEINAENHFYKILNPEQEENLVAYWKFCDGQGNAVKDYSVNGNNLKADNAITWIDVELPAKE